MKHFKEKRQKFAILLSLRIYVFPSDPADIRQSVCQYQFCVRSSYSVFQF